MFRFAIPAVLIVLCAAVFVGEFAYYYSQLPALSAVHFNAAGVPDGWMPKQKLVGFQFAQFSAIGLLTVVAAACVWLLPSGAINVPRKEFWFAPENETMARRMLLSRILWFWAAVWLFMAWLSHGILQINLGRAPTLNMYPALVLLFGFIAIWIGEFAWRFYRIPIPASASSAD